MFPSHPGLRAIAAYYLFYYGFVGVFSPYWGPYLRALGVSMAMIGLMTSLPQINRIYAPALWGWLADRTGRRSAILRLAGLGSLAGFSTLLFTQDADWMFAAILIASFFWSAALPQVEATTMSILKGDSGGYARLRIWGSVGFILATLAGGYFVDHWGVQALPALVVGIMAGVAILAWFVPDAGASRKQEGSAGLREILYRREVMALLGGCLLIGAAHGLLMGFYSIHLDEHHVAKRAMGWLWSLGVVAEIGLFWCMTHLTGRFRLRSLYLFAMSVAVVRYLMIGWGADWMTVLVAAQLLHAFTFAVHHAVSIAYVHRFFGAAHRTQGQALYIVFTFGIGGSLGTLLTGWFWNDLGGNWMFTMASLVSLLALVICWRWLKDTAEALSA
ncbi:MFS transporter, PPP family, 3-phenylpropionic acid transporter [Formivibrio citricus]|uniref:MFS transporter, PPP family, 3-phenylpropionic acid transporter n=1 Tax=Formivibrio citricus TaxID=83765 RepID=A0A1I4UWR3_9NEIS|nr:MFS transporter [Formivibrio citricus]SFM93203.1 MFS transporter, PPP family, 3-phenylpropionic acid transporter [Formivibrio citricus]